MKTLLQPFKLSCKKASALTDKASVMSLTRIEQFKLKMHVKACSICKAYQKHSEIIDKAVEKVSNEDPIQEPLSDDVKSTIIRKFGS